MTALTFIDQFLGFPALLRLAAFHVVHNGFGTICIIVWGGPNILVCVHIHSAAAMVAAAAEATATATWSVAAIIVGAPGTCGSSIPGQSTNENVPYMYMYGKSDMCPVACFPTTLYL